MFDFASYHRAATLADAINLLADNPQAKLLAGGTDVLIQLHHHNDRYRHIVDIHNLAELRGITLAEDGSLRIGSATTFTQLIEDPITQRHLPALCAAATSIAGPQIRNVANTAMDCARAALRVPGVEKATIVYRRSLQEMPAWREEYEEALHDGVEFRFLNNPERFDADGTLTLRVMSLGEPDEKGRRRPVETNETVTLLVDSLITAIGEQQDTEALNAMGVPLDKNGWPDVDHNGETRLTDVFMIGDVQRGPSSIVAAVGTARRATDAILSRENIRSHQNDKYWNNVNPAEIYQRKGDISITLVNSDDRDAFVAQEAARCLECNYVCSKCVDVCPNRANVSIAVPGFQNRFQTLHLDAYCNECGNCAQFCPWNGKPYKDKITVFSLAQDFDNSSNPGFLVEDCRVRVRLNNQSWVLNIDSKGQFNNVPPELNDMCRIISHVHQHHHYLLGRVEV